MAKKVGLGLITKIEPTHKTTSQGRKSVKMSSMNKAKKKSFKRYRGQGK
jgi:hypothetical protein